jgi:hypothetical protein
VDVFKLGTSPVYGWPSSPGENVSVEQKPSEDVIKRVKPSVDLFLSALIAWNTLEGCTISILVANWRTYQVKSVKVAQCRLLTTQMGVCC